MTPLSPTPLTDVHRTRFYELPTDASKHDCITLALSAISALEDTERSLAALEARNAELVKALQKYGRHTGGCNTHAGRDCSCGLVELRAALTEQHGGKP